MINDPLSFTDLRVTSYGLQVASWIVADRLLARRDVWRAGFHLSVIRIENEYLKSI